MVVRGGETELYYEMSGEGTNVVLLHEGVADSRMWEPQWGALAQAHRVIRYDMRGFGRSPLPPEPYSHAVDLVNLLKRLRIDRAVLIGASLGGRVALELAVSRPDLVAGLVLAGAVLPGHDWSSAFRAFAAAENDAFEKGDIEAAVEVNLRTWVDGRRPREEVNQEVRELVGVMQRQAFEVQLAAGDEAEEDLLEPRLDSRLGEIQQPSLVLVGEEDLSDIHEIAMRLRSELPNAHHSVIARTAHVAPLERPLEFNELALGFLGSSSL
jgi:3-oxoadipate enol-lactonase